MIFLVTEILLILIAVALISSFLGLAIGQRLRQRIPVLGYLPEGTASYEQMVSKLHSFRRKLDDTSTDKERLHGELDRHKRRISQLEQDLANAQKRGTDRAALQKRNAELENELAQGRVDWTARREELALLHDKLNALKDGTSLREEDLSRQLQDVTEQLRDSVQQYERLQSHAEAQEASLRDQLATARGAVRDLETAQNDQASKEADLLSKVDGLSAQLNSAESELSLQRQERGNLQRVVEQQRQELTVARDEGAMTRHDLGNRCQQIHGLRAELRAAEEERASHTSELQQSLEARDALRSQLDATTRERDGLRGQLVDARATASALTAAQDKMRIMDATTSELRKQLTSAEADLEVSRARAAAAMLKHQKLEIASNEDKTHLRNALNTAETAADALREGYALLDAKQAYLRAEAGRAYALRLTVERLKSKLGDARRAIGTLESELRVVGGRLDKEKNATVELTGHNARLTKQLELAIEAEVEATAHRLWTEEGKPSGRAQDHWARATEEVYRKRGLDVPTL